MTRSGMARYYRTTIVTGLPTAKPDCTTTGTAPLVNPNGTTKFTWYSPANPGARPAKPTVAACPPTVSVGSVRVLERAPPAPAGAPVAGGFDTGPRPVA